MGKSYKEPKSLFENNLQVEFDSAQSLVRVAAPEAARKQVCHLLDQLQHEDEFLHLARSGSGGGGGHGLRDRPQTLEADLGGVAEDASLQSKVPEWGVQ